MNIHEYQAKELLAKQGIPVPAGHAALSVDEAVAAAEKLPGPLWVVKAQIHAGGRGKGRFKELGPDAKGGVRLARSIDEVRVQRRGDARQDPGHDPDRRRGQAGQPPLRHRRSRHRQGILSRPARRPRQRPDRHGRLDRGRHGHRGGRPRHAREDHHHHHRSGHRASCPITAAPSPSRSASRAISTSRRRSSARQLYDAFVALDCAMLEINPLAATDDGKLLVLDAKMSFDSNAEFRHPDLEALRDESEEDPMEVEASKHDLAYIKLDGNIGCMVNGAGLAMATMDIIKLNGAEPGQFPRRRRRRLQGEGDGGVQDHPLRSGGEGHPRQHLRRDHALRHHRRRASSPRRRKWI